MLQNEDRKKLEGNAGNHHLDYVFDSGGVEIRARNTDQNETLLPSALVLPIVSPSGEKVRQVSPQRIEIEKEGGRVVVVANVPLNIKETPRSRVFNMVPGAEAVPVVAEFPGTQSEEIVCKIRVE